MNSQCVLKSSTYAVSSCEALISIDQFLKRQVLEFECNLQVVARHEPLEEEVLLKHVQDVYECANV